MTVAKSGAPRGNNNAYKHGLVSLKNAIKRRTRRGRNYIDRRIAAGQDALRLQAGLVEDMGGLENMTTATFIAVEGLTREVFFRDLMDVQITKLLRKYEKAKNPRVLAKLYSYRSPISRNIHQYLTLLGLDKKPTPQKTDLQVFIRLIWMVPEGKLVGRGESNPLGYVVYVGKASRNVPS